MVITKTDSIVMLDEKTQEKKTKSLHNLKMAAEGETFIVALLKNGKVQVYDKELNLCHTQNIPGAEKIIANSRIIVQLKNGYLQFYDRNLKLQFCRQVA